MGAAAGASSSPVATLAACIAGVGGIVLLSQVQQVRGSLPRAQVRTQATLVMASGSDAQLGDVGGPGNEALKELWASAYEGWVEPPGAQAREAVYLSPQAVDVKDAADAPDWVEKTLEVAEQFDGVFGITAFNPMGQDRSHTENMEQNSLLESDIKQLCDEIGGRWWRSFGFATDWHEKGFTVAAPQNRVVELAVKFKQGAIYRFYRAPPGSGMPFMRATVPACLPDTEADVPVGPCLRPEFARAEATWAPGPQA